MNWSKPFKALFPEHKYAIQSALLGDHATLAWSNLGYWQAEDQDYPSACQALADTLARALNLRSEDHLLDLGCGQGASLQHWHNAYQVQSLTAVELQRACVERISQFSTHQNLRIEQLSFLNLNSLQFTDPFDVVVCIDAAYHSSLITFLENIELVLAEQGRLGFHYLMLSEKWNDLSVLQRKKYGWLLKAADVNLNHLMTQQDTVQCLERFGFTQIGIQDFSEEVLHGFSQYVELHLAFQLLQKHDASMFDELKIKMTAKLCRKLFEDGLVRYVQIVAS